MNDPEKRAELLRRDRERWHARKNTGKDLTEKQIGMLRYKWRKQKRDYRHRAKCISKVLANSPPRTRDTARPLSRQFLKSEVDELTQDERISTNVPTFTANFNTLP